MLGRVRYGGGSVGAGPVDVAQVGAVPASCWRVLNRLAWPESAGVS